MVHPRSRPPALVGHLRKVTKKVFEYVCEWIGCDYTTNCINALNDHVAAHRRGYTACLGKDNEIREGEYAFFCHWQDCGAQIVGDLEDFSRHVFYHTFHQYLKHMGQHIIDVEQIRPCMLDSQSRNVIPELPEKLQCRWGDCHEVHDNPYIFYFHVAFHTDDMPMGNNLKNSVKCQWEDCTATCKSRYKMKEHIRSHTQAKVVACPTCGALFSNNTKFLDHIKRQFPEKAVNYQCTHCNRVFCSERLLRDHSRRHVNHYKCPMCDMTVNHPSGLREHIRYRHSDMREYNCHKCDYLAKSQKDLYRHYEEQHEKGKEGDYACGFDKCLKKFETLKDLFLHRDEEHENPPRLFQCHICHKDFTRGFILTQHYTSVHNVNWPSGHKRFRYKVQDDGYRRLQTVRYESIEVTEQILGRKLTGDGRKEDTETPGENATSAVTGSKSDHRFYGDSRDSESNSETATTEKNSEQVLPTDSASETGRAASSSSVLGREMEGKRRKSKNGNEESSVTGGKGKGKMGTNQKGGKGGKKKMSKGDRGEDDVDERGKGKKSKCKLKGRNSKGEDDDSEMDDDDDVFSLKGSNKKVSFKDLVDNDDDDAVVENRKKSRKRKRVIDEDEEEEDDDDCQMVKKKLKKNSVPQRRGRRRPKKKKNVGEKDKEGVREEFQYQDVKGDGRDDVYSLDSNSSSFMPQCGPSTSRQYLWSSGVQALSDDSSNSSTLYFLSNDHDETSLSRHARDLDSVLLNDDEDEEVKSISPKASNDNAYISSMPTFEHAEEVLEEPSSPTRYMLNFTALNEGEEEFEKSEDGGEEEEEGTLTEIEEEDGVYIDNAQDEEEVDENVDREEVDEDVDREEVDEDGEDEADEDVGEDEADEDIDVEEADEEEEEEEDAEEDEDGNEEEEADEEVEEEIDDEEDYDAQAKSQKEEAVEDIDEMDPTGLVTDVETEEDENEEEMEEIERGGQSPTRYTLATPRDESPTLYALPSPIARSPQSPSRYELNSPFGGCENAQSPTRYALNSPERYDSENAQSPTLYCLKSPRFTFPPRMASSPTRYTLQTAQDQFDENAQSPTQYTLLNSSWESNSRYALETPTHPSSSKSTPRHNNESFKTIVGIDDPSQSPTLYQLKSPFHNFSYSSQFNTSKMEESPGSVTLTEDNVEYKSNKKNLSRISSSIYNSSKGSPSITHHHSHNFKSPSSTASPRVSHQAFQSPGPSRVKSPLSFRSAFQQLIRAVDGIEGPRTSSPLTIVHSEDKAPSTSSSVPADHEFRMSNTHEDGSESGGEFRLIQSAGKTAGVSRDVFESQLSSVLSGTSRNYSKTSTSFVGGCSNDANLQGEVKLESASVGTGGELVASDDSNNRRNKNDINAENEEAGVAVDNNESDKIIQTADGQVFLQIGSYMIPIEQNMDGLVRNSNASADNLVVKSEACSQESLSAVSSDMPDNTDRMEMIKEERSQSEGEGLRRTNTVIIKQDVVSQSGESVFKLFKTSQNNDESGQSMFLNVREKTIELHSSSSDEIKNEEEVRRAPESSGNFITVVDGHVIKTESIPTKGEDDNARAAIKQEVKEGDMSVGSWETYNLEMLGEVALKTHSRNSMDQSL